MSTLLTYIAVNGGKIQRSSLEVLSHMKTLADAGGHTAAAVVISDKAGSYTDEISKYGASEIYTIENPIFKNHRNAPVLKALAKVMDAASPSVFAFASSESVKDILGALAAGRDAAVLSDVSSFELTGNGIKAKRPVMASKVLADVEATGNTVIVSVRSGSYDLKENPSEAKTTAVDFEIDESSIRAILREVASADGDTIDLNEADTIVAAGRGVKDDEGKALISELAAVLHAGVGATRALTEAGVYDHGLQIGQTGKVVSPQLYIAVGISGAIQHVAGMINSKVIVAINKDPDAPIFEIADYGIVGDLYQILPPFIDELKKIKAQ